MTHSTNEIHPDPRGQFFATNRRKLVLEHLLAQRNKKGDDKKLVFSFRMPLSTQRLDGFPSFLSPAFEAINKQDSLVTECPLGDFQLESMTLEFFTTEQGKRRIVLWTGVTLYDFNVIREDDGDNFNTVLLFKIRVKQTRSQFIFYDDHGDKPLWCDFVPTADNTLKRDDGTQMSLMNDPTPVEQEAATAGIEDYAEEAEDEGEDDEKEGDWPEQSPEAAAAIADLTPEEVAAGAKGTKAPRGFAPKKWR